MGALGWLLNLQFRGGLFVPTEPAFAGGAPKAIETRRRGPDQLETVRRNMQAFQCGHSGGAQAIETEIRVLSSVVTDDPTPTLTDEWTHIILDSDFTTPSINAVAYPDNYYATGLLWTPEPSKRYWFKCHLLLTYSGTLGTEPGFTWPTNLTEHAILLECAGATAVTAFPSAAWGTNDGDILGTDPVSVQLAGAHSAGALSHAVGEGFIETSASTTGSLEVRINRQAAGGAATTHTLKAGSWLAWQEVP